MTSENDKINAAKKPVENTQSPAGEAKMSIEAFESEIDDLKNALSNAEQLLSQERELRQNQEISLEKVNEALAEKINKLERIRLESESSRRAALNLMEDAIASKDALRINEERMRWQKEAFQAAMNGASLEHSLDIIASLVIEESAGEARVAFYMADAEGEHLHPVFGAGNMPMDYLKEIDGFIIGEDSLACGLAIPKGKPILTTDVFEDPRWVNWTQIAQKYDYRGCWSFPIKTFDNKAIGTFAMYFKQPRQAKSEDLSLAGIVSQTAAVIIASFSQARERLRMESALRESEYKYRTLFTTIDEGFCIIEMIYDEDKIPINWRFVEVNPAFELNNGLVNATGKTILDLRPDIETKWFEIYGQVTKTGEALRFEEHSIAFNRWFSLYAFRTGNPEQNRVAVLFRDTSERKRREANLAFLAEISETFAQISSVSEIMQVVSKKIATHLNITTCNFTDVDESKDLVTVYNGWNDPSVPSTTGSFKLSQYLNDEFIRASKAGETVIIRDTQNDPRTNAEEYAGLNMFSFITVPFHLKGKWTHYLAICDSKPREWLYEEIELIEELANRILPRLERARTEEALVKVKEEHLLVLEKEVSDRTADLNESRNQLQSVLDTTAIQMSILQAIRNENGEVSDFEIIVANRELMKETGDNNLVGKHYAAEYPGIKENGLFDLIVKTIDSGKPQQADYFYPHEGFNKWYSSMFIKFNDGVVASNIDISSRKMAEEERFKTYLLMQQTEDVALLGSWDYDLESKKFTCSDGMYRLFNQPSKSDIKPEIYIQYATKKCMSTAKRLVDSIHLGEEIDEEIIKISVESSIKSIKIKTTLIKNSDGGAGRLIGVNMDVSSTIEAAEKLRRMEEEQQTNLFRATLQTEEEEKRRISESLHNGLGQLLYGIKLSLGQLSLKHAIENAEKYQSSHQYASSLLTDAIRDSRRISHELMPSVLEEFGLKAAVREVCQQMSNEIKLKCTVKMDEEDMDKYMQLAVFRIFQELVLNMAKHSKASIGLSSLKFVDGIIELNVQDNGVGFYVEKIGSHGIGLNSIRSKVDLLNGRFEIDSNAGKGTTVLISIPYTKLKKLNS